MVGIGGGGRGPDSSPCSQHPAQGRTGWEGQEREATMPMSRGRVGGLLSTEDQAASSLPTPGPLLSLGAWVEGPPES